MTWAGTLDLRPSTRTQGAAGRTSGIGFSALGAFFAQQQKDDRGPDAIFAGMAGARRLWFEAAFPPGLIVTPETAGRFTEKTHWLYIILVLGAAFEVEKKQGYRGEETVFSKEGAGEWRRIQTLLAAAGDPLGNVEQAKALQVAIEQSKFGRTVLKFVRNQLKSGKRAVQKRVFATLENVYRSNAARLTKAAGKAADAARRRNGDQDSEDSDGDSDGEAPRAVGTQQTERAWVQELATRLADPTSLDEIAYSEIHNMTRVINEEVRVERPALAKKLAAFFSPAFGALVQTFPDVLMVPDIPNLDRIFTHRGVVDQSVVTGIRAWLSRTGRAQPLVRTEPRSGGGAKVHSLMGARIQGFGTGRERERQRPVGPPPIPRGGGGGGGGKGTWSWRKAGAVAAGGVAILASAVYTVAITGAHEFLFVSNEIKQLREQKEVLESALNDTWITGDDNLARGVHRSQKLGPNTDLFTQILDVVGNSYVKYSAVDFEGDAVRAIEAYRSEFLGGVERLEKKKEDNRKNAELIVFKRNEKETEKKEKETEQNTQTAEEKEKAEAAKLAQTRYDNRYLLEQGMAAELEQVVKFEPTVRITRPTFHSMFYRKEKNNPNAKITRWRKGVDTFFDDDDDQYTYHYNRGSITDKWLGFGKTVDWTDEDLTEKDGGLATLAQLGERLEAAKTANVKNTRLSAEIESLAKQIQKFDDELKKIPTAKKLDDDFKATKEKLTKLQEQLTKTQKAGKAGGTPATRTFLDKLQPFLDDENRLGNVIDYAAKVFADNPDDPEAVVAALREGKNESGIPGVNIPAIVDGTETLGDAATIADAIRFQLVIRLMHKVGNRDTQKFLENMLHKQPNIQWRMLTDAMEKLFFGSFSHRTTAVGHLFVLLFIAYGARVEVKGSLFGKEERTTSIRDIPFVERQIQTTLTIFGQLFIEFNLIHSASTLTAVPWVAVAMKTRVAVGMFERFLLPRLRPGWFKFHETAIRDLFDTFVPFVAHAATGFSGSWVANALLAASIAHPVLERAGVLKKYLPNKSLWINVENKNKWMMAITGVATAWHLAVPQSYVFLSPTHSVVLLDQFLTAMNFQRDRQEERQPGSLPFPSTEFTNKNPSLGLVSTGLALFGGDAQAALAFSLGKGGLTRGINTFWERVTSESLVDWGKAVDPIPDGTMKEQYAIFTLGAKHRSGSAYAKKLAVRLMHGASVRTQKHTAKNSWLNYFPFHEF